MITEFPASFREAADCEPVMQEFPGWPEIDPAAKSIDDLHPNARQFVEFISRRQDWRLQ